MKTQPLWLTAGLLVLLAAALVVFAATGKTPPPARDTAVEAAIDLGLPDVYGKVFTLKEFAGQIVVIDFISVRCPWSLAYDDELRRLWRKYSTKGVQFLAINSNRNDTPAEIKAHQIANDLTFPILIDKGNKVADQYAAQTTPQVYIVDAGGRLVYAGKPCDGGPPDSLGLDKNSFAAVLDDLLAGKTLEPIRTKPWGCTIKRVPAAGKPAAR